MKTYGFDQSMDEDVDEELVALMLVASKLENLNIILSFYFSVTQYCFIN